MGSTEWVCRSHSAVDDAGDNGAYLPNLTWDASMLFRNCSVLLDLAGIEMNSAWLAWVAGE
eukprot:10235493-Ditylum_brightwellii.AAC.1